MLSAALGTGCDAVHPGYGFLSENPAFAAACVAEGLVFVGPRPEAVAQAGDKARARELARSAGIPTLSGSPVLDTADQAARAAAELGYPVLAKAAAGGGGRGMSVVEDEAGLRSRWAAAGGEALAAFGDGRLYVERFVRNARHIEVQVLGDKHGNVIHIDERDCTLQRRHQKVVEESPAPNIPEDVRRDIRRSGVAFAEALALDSAGTVEFIYDADTSFGVGGDVLADRAEHQPRKAAVTARADHQQVGVRRLLDEQLRRSALLDVRLNTTGGTGPWSNARSPGSWPGATGGCGSAEPQPTTKAAPKCRLAVPGSPAVRMSNSRRSSPFRYRRAGTSAMVRSTDLRARRCALP